MPYSLYIPTARNDGQVITAAWFAEIQGALALASAEILTKMAHNGTSLAFFGANAVAQRGANPDTTGATVAALEAEINELKSLLRAYGLMAT